MANVNTAKVWSGSQALDIAAVGTASVSGEASANRGEAALSEEGVSAAQDLLELERSGLSVNRRSRSCGPRGQHGHCPDAAVMVSARKPPLAGVTTAKIWSGSQALDIAAVGTARVSGDAPACQSEAALSEEEVSVAQDLIDLERSGVSVDRRCLGPALLKLSKVSD